MISPTPLNHVIDTAYWMASYRAIESQKKDALFHDPLASVLVGEKGQAVTKTMKPFEKYAYWALVMRTLVIDELLLKYAQIGFKTFINIGAGLDTRPYRLKLPPDTLWIEIDFPNVIEMKNEKLINQTPLCRLERIALDLSNATERRKTLSELNQRIGPAVFLTEGVIPYLSEETVAELATDLKSLSNFQYWISEYYSPVLYKRFQSPSFSGRLGGSPFKFYPQNWFEFFKDQGWKQKEIHFLYDKAMQVKRDFPLPWPLSWVRLWVGAEKFAPRLRLQAYYVMEKV